MALALSVRKVGLAMLAMSKISKTTVGSLSEPILFISEIYRLKLNKNNFKKNNFFTKKN